MSRWSGRLRRARTLAPACLVLAAGCGSDGGAPTADPAASVRGDTTVLVPGAPRHATGGTLTPALSIGEIEGADEYVFGNVRDAAVGAGGAIYVLDSQAQTVRRYDATGRFTGRIAGPGDGPGELTAAGMLAAHPDGRILVAETSGEIHAYGPEDGTADTWNTGLDIGEPLVVGRDGVVYVPLGRGPDPPVRADDPGRITRGGPFYIDVVRGHEPPGRPATLRLAPDGTVLDTVLAPPTADLVNYLVHPAGRVYVGLDYRPRAWWGWSPLGYRLTGRTDRYQIDLHLERADGTDSIVSLRPPREAVPLPAGARDALREQLESLSSGSETEWRREQGVPDRKPFYHRVVPAGDGRLWTRVHLPSVERASPDGSGGSEWYEPESAFDVYTPGGDYLGEVRGPPAIRATWIRNDTVLAISTDPLGVDRVVLFVAEWR